MRVIQPVRHEPDAAGARKLFVQANTTTVTVTATFTITLSFVTIRLLVPLLIGSLAEMSLLVSPYQLQHRT